MHHASRITVLTPFCCQKRLSTTRAGVLVRKNGLGVVAPVEVRLYSGHKCGDGFGDLRLDPHLRALGHQDCAIENRAVGFTSDLFGRRTNAAWWKNMIRQDRYLSRLYRFSVAQSEE